MKTITSFEKDLIKQSILLKNQRLKVKEACDIYNKHYESFKKEKEILSHIETEVSILKNTLSGLYSKKLEILTK